LPLNVRRPRVERRNNLRPSNGDAAVCPKCLARSLEFNERYRLPSGSGKLTRTPAWVCDQPACGYYRRVRAEDDLTSNTPKLRMAAMKLRAVAKRQQNRTVAKRLARKQR